MEPLDAAPDPSSPGSFAAARSALQRAQQAGDALFGVLDRLIPLARRVASFVRMMMIAGLVAAGIILLSVLTIDVPRTPVPWLGILVAAAVLLLPAVVLRLFYRALEEVLELPGWLRSSPEIARRHATELAVLVAQANGQAAPPGATTGPTGRRRVRGGDAWRAGRLLLEAKNDLPEYGSALRLISPFFLFMVALALAGVCAEIVFALLAALVAAGAKFM